MEYPNSDSTDTDIKKVLYKAGLKTFNEDFQTSELYREQEEVTRFNSIVKTPGIVAKKAEVSLRMFPTPVTGTQITISAGTGFTNNGARITIPDLSITDITALTGYQNPAALTEGSYEYLILRKKVLEYGPRSHPISGTAENTRSMFYDDNSIVECYVTDTITDNDIIILGRLTSIGPVAFDTTESTGGRKILRVGEVPFLETTGGIMDGDIDMQNLYEILNLPQWGATSGYRVNGSVNNRDFIRLFARMNGTIVGLKGIKFSYESAQYGIRFSTSAGSKLSFLPNQQPPNRIDVTISNTFVPIPDNNVIYVELNDSNVGLVLTRGDNIYIVNSDIFIKQNYLTTNNIGTQAGSKIIRFPIAYHYYDATNNVRRLVLANGFNINLNDEIDESGRYSAYVNKDGSTVMSGSLQIEADNPNVIIRTADSKVPVSDKFNGIEWKKPAPNHSVVIGRITRIRQFTTGSKYATGDTIISVLDDNAQNGNEFIFHLDGRMTVPTAPEDVYDVARLTELNTKVNKSGDTMTGELVNKVGITVEADEPFIRLIDTAPTVGSAGIKILVSPDRELARIYRHSDITDTRFAEGDLEFTSMLNSGSTTEKYFRFNYLLNQLEASNLLVSGDVWVGGDLTISEDLTVGNDGIFNEDVHIFGKTILYYNTYEILERPLTYGGNTFRISDRRFVMHLEKTGTSAVDYLNTKDANGNEVKYIPLKQILSSSFISVQNFNIKVNYNNFTNRAFAGLIKGAYAGGELNYTTETLISVGTTPATGSGAYITVNISGGVVTNWTIWNGGFGYTAGTASVVQYTGETGTIATATFTVNAVGTITTITQTNAGTGYTDSLFRPVTLFSVSVSPLPIPIISTESGINVLKLQVPATLAGVWSASVDWHEILYPDV